MDIQKAQNKTSEWIDIAKQYGANKSDLILINKSYLSVHLRNGKIERTEFNENIQGIFRVQ